MLASESPEDDLYKLMNKEIDPIMEGDEGVYDYENVVVNKLKIPD